MEGADGLREALLDVHAVGVAADHPPGWMARSLVMMIVGLSCPRHFTASWRMVPGWLLSLAAGSSTALGRAAPGRSTLTAFYASFGSASRAGSIFGVRTHAQGDEADPPGIEFAQGGLGGEL